MPWKSSLAARALFVAACACAFAGASARAATDAQAADAASRAASRAPAVPAGTAVPIGGALAYDNDAVWSRLVAATGGRGSRWAVFATASGDPAATGAKIAGALRRRGAVVDVIPVAPKLAGTDVAAAVRDPALVARVRAVRGVFFSGGAQERIVDALQPGGEASPLLDAIRDVQRAGGVIAGTSAGAAVMSATMFRDAVNPVAVLKGTLRDGLEVDRGLGFVGPGLFVDQHFLRRGRLARMLPLMVAKGYALGLGVDEDTAAFVAGDVVEIVGTRAALVVDLTDAHADTARGALDLRGARLHLLENGDRFDLARRETLPSPAKLAARRLDPGSPGFGPYYDDAPFFLDIGAEGALAAALTHVVDGRSPEIRGLASDVGAGVVRPELGFEFRLYRGRDTLAWFANADGREAYTISNVRLDVTPVRVATPLYSAWP